MDTNHKKMQAYLNELTSAINTLHESVDNVEKILGRATEILGSDEEQLIGQMQSLVNKICNKFIREEGQAEKTPGFSTQDEELFNRPDVAAEMERIAREVEERFALKKAKNVRIDFSPPRFDLFSQPDFLEPSPVTPRQPLNPTGTTSQAQSPTTPQAQQPEGTEPNNPTTPRPLQQGNLEEEQNPTTPQAQQSSPGIIIDEVVQKLKETELVEEEMEFGEGYLNDPESQFIEEGEIDPLVVEPER